MLRNPIDFVLEISPGSDCFSPPLLPSPLSEPPWSHVDSHDPLLVGLHYSTLIFLQLHSGWNDTFNIEVVLCHSSAQNPEVA